MGLLSFILAMSGKERHQHSSVVPSDFLERTTNYLKLTWTGSPITPSPRVRITGHPS